MQWPPTLSGNVLVAGNFTSPSLDLDPGPGTYILPNAGGTDGYAAKYDPAGNLLLGRPGRRERQWVRHRMAVDGAGNVLIGGSFAGSIEIGAPGRPPVTLTNSGINEGFVAKIDPAGNALWARTFGAAADPRLANGIATDAAGNVYATGERWEPALRRQVQRGRRGGVDPGRLGQHRHRPTFAGQSVAVDTAGNVLVAGTYLGKIDFNPDPMKTNYLTSIATPPDDAFVLKLNATGAYVWAGSMGGPGATMPRGRRRWGGQRPRVGQLRVLGTQERLRPRPGDPEPARERRHVRGQARPEPEPDLGPQRRWRPSHGSRRCGERVHHREFSGTSTPTPDRGRST